MSVMFEELEPRVESVEETVKALAEKQEATRGAVTGLKDEVVELKGVVVDLRGIVVEGREAAAADRDECRKALADLKAKLEIRVKWANVAKAAGTFAGGALVAFVPAQSEKVAAIVSKLLELIP